MPTKKQKQAMRNRQKLQQRETPKAKQIKALLDKLESVPVNAFTGQPEFKTKE